MTLVGQGSIGIFDSGVGGLSVLRHIKDALPGEHLVYLADAGYAPYGDKPEALIVARSLAIAGFLVGAGVKALVVACNTATAAAIEAIRLQFPAIAVVGVEPGLKPAADLSRTRVVGVLATASTLASARFAALQLQIASATGVVFLLQPCLGLADQIEKGELRSPATARLVDSLVTPLLARQADALVLGCTHYPFVVPLIEACVARNQPESSASSPPSVFLVDTGSAVARQLAAVLQARGLVTDASGGGTLTAVTTGSRSNLQHALRRLLSISVPVSQLALESLPAAAQSAGLPL